MNLPSMWDQLDGSTKVDGSLKRAAQLRKDLTRWEREGNRIMERVIENREDANAAGLDVGLHLAKPSAAYMDAWVAGDEKERIELVTVKDAPLPPVHDDNS